MNLHPALLVGIALATMGWVVLPWAVRISGFLLGVAVAVLIVDLASLAFPDFRPNSILFLGAAVVLGFLGSLLVSKIFRASFFVVGFVATVFVQMRLEETYGLSNHLSGGAWGDFPATIWFTLICGLIGGFLLGLLKKYVIVVLTALAGAILVARYGGLEEKWLLLALVGTAIQVFCISALPKKWTRAR